MNYLNRHTLCCGLLLAVVSLFYTRLNTMPAVHATLLNWNENLITFLTHYGLLGAFLNSFITNASLVIQIPYQPIFIFLAGQAKSTMFLIALVAVGATGSTLGEIVSFYLGRGVGAALFKENSVVAWMRQVVENRPKLASLFIFLIAATPLPDDQFLILLGLMGYPARKIVLPTLIGKTILLSTIVYLSHYAHLSAADYVGLERIDPTTFLLLMILFVIFIAYQAKGRPAQKIRPGDGAEVDGPCFVGDDPQQ